MNSCRSLFFIFFITASMSTYSFARSKESHPFLKKNGRLKISVLNETGVSLEDITATFRFTGINELGEEFIDGEVKVRDIKKDASVLLESKDAMYQDKNVEDLFRPSKKNKKFKLTNIQLMKLSASRWRIPGTNFKLRTARAAYKSGTYYTHFFIRTKKGRFGNATYVIEPSQQYLNEQIEY